MLVSGSTNVRFAVESPAVGSPKERVCGRPMKAMVTASPELPVRGLVSTATYAESRRESAGVTGSLTTSFACQSGPAPALVTNDPRPAFPRKGSRPPSIGHMLPPVLARRLTTQRKVYCFCHVVRAALVCVYFLSR